MHSVTLSVNLSCCRLVDAPV